MTSKRISLICILVITFLTIGLLALNHHPKLDAPTGPRCSTAADPCIQIDLDNHISYKLNDFQFMPKKCIIFVSLPDRMQRKFSGNYNLKWIGPELEHRLAV